MSEFDIKNYKKIFKNIYTIKHNGVSFSGTIEEIIDFFKIDTVPSVVAGRIQNRVNRSGSNFSLEDAFFLPQTKYKYYNGELRTVEEVSNETGIPVVTLNKRMFNKGVDLETAAKMKSSKRAPLKYSYDGFEGSCKEIVNKFNPEMDANVFSARVRQGWDIERALFAPIERRVTNTSRKKYQRILKDELLNKVYSYKDYNGTIADIINHFNLNCSIHGVCRRLSMNWPIDSALECDD